MAKEEKRDESIYTKSGKRKKKIYERELVKLPSTSGPEA
jgi:hypothetical protein